MSGEIQMRLFSGLVAAISLAGVIYIYTVPPESLRTTRDGVPHFAPPVINPATGEPIDLGTLVRHYKGE